MEQQNQTPSAGGSGLAPNVASLLCYLCGLVTGIIFLVIEKNNRDVKFHAWQSIFLGITVFVLYIAVIILAWIFTLISPTLGGIVSLLTFVVMLGYLVVWVLAMVKAYQGERWQIPVIGKFAEQQASK